MKRRAALGALASVAALGGGLGGLAGCMRDAPQGPGDTGPEAGGFTGQGPSRGHRLREPRAAGEPARTRRTGVLIAGGGMAGLAAARALRLSGIEDFALLELEDEPGGNSRALELGGMPCPLGAHYLPVPGEDAHEVADLLEELGLRRRVAGRWVVDERHLCHSPQERLYFNGQWRAGLLPVDGVDARTLEQYARFARLVDELGRQSRYTLPATRTRLTAGQLALDARRFDAWLDAQGFSDPLLRAYLDYCCRDDYGAGIDTVSAWAGVHYFASRHGFTAPGTEGGTRDAVLTWPEGNAWLARRLAEPLGDRVLCGRTVCRVAPGRHGVEVDAWADAPGAAQPAGAAPLERWQARVVIIALPVHVARRVVDPVPLLLREAADSIAHASWVVSNLRLSGPLYDAGQAPSAWDNVIHGSASLGYVDAGHQRLDPTPAPTVLTHYQALGIGPAARRALLEEPWTAWRERIVQELAAPHRDLPRLLMETRVTRHGHAMACPVPGTQRRVRAAGWPAEAVAASRPRPLATGERLLFAHADWAGYSVFEEAFTLGHAAGRRAALGLRR